MKIDNNVERFFDEIETMREKGIVIAFDEKGKDIYRSADIIDYISCMIKYRYYNGGIISTNLRVNAAALMSEAIQRNCPSAAKAMKKICESRFGKKGFDYEADVVQTNYKFNDILLSLDDKKNIHKAISESKLPADNYSIFHACLIRKAYGYEVIPQNAISKQVLGEISKPVPSENSKPARRVRTK